MSNHYVHSFHTNYQVHGHRIVHNMPLLSFNVHEICSDVPSFISEISNLCLLYFFLVCLVKWLSVLPNFSQELNFGFCWFLYWFSVFNFDFTYCFFCSAHFGFYFHFFSSFKKCKVRFLILDLFKIYAFSVLNYPLNALFTASYKFC